MNLFNCDPQYSSTTTASQYNCDTSSNDSSYEDLKSPTTIINTTTTTKTMTLKNGLPSTSDSVMRFDLSCKTIFPLADYKMQYPTEITVCSFDVDEDLLSWEMIDDTNTATAKWKMVILDVAEIDDSELVTRNIETNNVAVAVLQGGEQKGLNVSNSNNNNDVTHTTDEDCGVTIIESDSDTYISGIFSLPPVDNGVLPSAPRTILPLITTVVATNTTAKCSFPSCNVENTDCHCAFCTCYNTEDTDPCQCAVCTIQ